MDGETGGSIRQGFMIYPDPPGGGYNPHPGFMQHPLTCIQQRGVIRGGGVNQDCTSL